ncbi:MAG TPA: hypothetical protein VMS60_06830 [Solirubrobacterales bacterium]|nr:hypothetical protein [Solirubrobacterales bacterium]
MAVLIVSATGGDDSTSSSTATVADGQPKDPAEAKGAKNSADGKPKKSGAKSDGSASGAAPAEEEAGFTGSAGGGEEPSGGDTGSSGSEKGSKGGGKVGGLGDSASHGSKKSKKKKKKSKAAQAPKVDPETAAASAVLEAYMAARAAQNWPTACAQMTPKAISSLERFAGAGRGCAATFTAFYPHLVPGSWDNTMTGPITTLRADGVAIYHGTTGRDYAMPMLKEGGGWKVAAVGPTAVS